MSDETIESNAIEALQGAELMGRPLRINKAEPRGGGGSRRNGTNYNGYNKGSYNNRGGGYGANNSGGYGANNTGGYGSGGFILNLLPTQVGHLVLRDGRIEAMETLQTILNTKVVEVDGEGAFQVKVIHLMSKSKTPFLQVVSLFLVKNLYSILF